MAATKRLFIEIGLNIAKARQALGGLKNMVNLVKSSFAALARTTFVGGIFAAFRAGFQTINNVQQGIMQLTSQMAELNLATIRTASVASEGGSGFQEAFNQAAQSARELSTQVNFTAQQVQEGLFTAAQAGLDLNQSLGFTHSALMLAATSGEEFKGIMNDMIGISRAFGVEYDKIPQMADAITGASQKSKVSVQGLFEGLKNVASVSNTVFGESVETFQDMTAALMTLNDAGIENSTAGVKLRAAMQQLNSGTAKTTATFSKYGVNIYKADGANQQYLDTLLKSQKAYADYDDQLNSLKNKQFDLVIANKQGTDEYAETTSQINELTETIGTLEQGMDRVQDQFNLAGGQLKPFHELMDELKSVPKEAIGRAFGIRGGEAILRLLQSSDGFSKNREEVKKFMEESERGNSILANVYEKFFSSVLIKWQTLKNDVIAIFSVIADAAFQAFSPLFDPLEMGLKALYSNIEENKDIFRQMFEGISNLLKPIAAQIGIVFGVVGSKMKDIFAEGKSLTVPIVTYNQESGRFDETEKTSSGTIAEKIGLAAEALISVLSAGFQRAVKTLEPFFAALSKPFVDGLVALMEAKLELFIKLGTQVGLAIATTMIDALKKYVPQLMAFIKGELGRVKIDLGLPFGKKGGISYEPSEAAMNAGKEAIKAAAATSGGPNTAIEGAIKSGAASLKPAAASSSAGSGYIEMNGVGYDIDMNALNEASKSAGNSGQSLNNTLKTAESAFKKLSDAELQSRRTAERMQRSDSLKALKGK